MIKNTALILLTLFLFGCESPKVSTWKVLEVGVSSRVGFLWKVDSCAIMLVNIKSSKTITKNIEGPHCGILKVDTLVDVKSFDNKNYFLDLSTVRRNSRSVETEQSFK